MNNTTLIRMVISTLNDVEVKGKDNLDKLLGCINALESVVQVTDALDAQSKEPAKVNRVNTEHHDPNLNIDTEEANG